MPRSRRRNAAYVISAVARQFGVHPQTLRLYEREGLLKPSRSEGNTRLYTEEDLERLEVILSLTRDMGVNLAGVEIILGMRDKMMEMQRQTQAFLEFVRSEWLQRQPGEERRTGNALVPVVPSRPATTARPPSPKR